MKSSLVHFSYLPQLADNDDNFLSNLRALCFLENGMVQTVSHVQLQAEVGIGVDIMGICRIPSGKVTIVSNGKLSSEQALAIAQMVERLEGTVLFASRNTGKGFPSYVVNNMFCPLKGYYTFDLTGVSLSFDQNGEAVLNAWYHNILHVLSLEDTESMVQK